MEKMIIKKSVTSFNDIKRVVEQIKARSFDLEECAIASVLSGDKVQLSAQTLMGGAMLPLSDWALTQLSNHAGVPMSYVNKCLDTGKAALVVKNLNSWLQDQQHVDKRYLVRVMASDTPYVRGILSNRYTRFDSDEILNIAQETLPVNDLEVCGHFVNEQRVHIRLKEKELLPIDGEDLFGGIMIDTSDVGRCAIRISFFIYKQVCTNGLCLARSGGLLFSQKHIGVSREEMEQEIREKLELLPAFREEMITLIKNAKAATFKKEEVEKILQKLKQKQGVSDKNLKKIVDLMDARYGVSKFGLINGITEVAQEYDLETRLELEKFAGDLLAA